MIHDIKNVIGFIIIYPIVLFIIPYYLYFNAHNTLFLTYFANVDIIANILSINFPSYFKNYYDIDPEGISQYVSYNAISIAALSGIFIHGIGLKNTNRHSDLAILATLILMSIITWTLPTQLIPYITKKIKEYYNIKDKTYDILITTLVSLFFIVIEGILIHLLVYDNRFFKNTFIQNVKFKF
jgi:hypothetical protein